MVEIKPPPNREWFFRYDDDGDRFELVSRIAIPHGFTALYLQELKRAQRARLPWWLKWL